MGYNPKENPPHFSNRWNNPLILTIYQFGTSKSVDRVIFVFWNQPAKWAETLACGCRTWWVATAKCFQIMSDWHGSKKVRVMMMCLGYMMVTWLLFLKNVGKFLQDLPKNRKGFHYTDDLLLGSRRFLAADRSFSLPRTPKVVRGVRWSNLTHMFQMGWFNHQPVQFDGAHIFSDGLVQLETHQLVKLGRWWFGPKLYLVNWHNII